MTNSFIYKGRLSSLNEYISSCRRHPQIGAEMKREAQEAVCWQIMIARSRGEFRAVTKPCRVKFEWHEKTAKRDLDNISGYGRKIILDALVSMKILPNDTQKWVRELQDKFFIDKNGEEYIKVEIEEIEE